MLDGELIEGHVIAEGVDNPVAPGPVGAAAVVLIAIGVGVAGGIEPEEGHALGVGIGIEKGVDEFPVGAVGLKFGKLGRGGLEAGQGEGRAAGEGGEVGRGRGLETFVKETFPDEMIDGVFVGRDGRLLRWDETPVVFVLRALLDPFLDELFLLIGEGAVGVLGGHGVGVVENAVDDFGVFGVAGDDGGGAFVILVGKFREVEGDVAFTGIGILAVAVETVLGENGADVFVVGDLFFGLE